MSRRKSTYDEDNGGHKVATLAKIKSAVRQHLKGKSLNLTDSTLLELYEEAGDNFKIFMKNVWELNNSKSVASSHSGPSLSVSDYTRMLQRGEISVDEIPASIKQAYRSSFQAAEARYKHQRAEAASRSTQEMVAALQMYNESIGSADKMAAKTEVFGLMSKYNISPDEVRSLFAMSFPGVADPVFFTLPPFKASRVSSASGSGYGSGYGGPGSGSGGPPRGGYGSGYGPPRGSYGSGYGSSYGSGYGGRY